MSKLPVRRVIHPTRPRVDSYAVDHSLDTDQSPDDYLAALVGRAVIGAGLRLLNGPTGAEAELQPDPRSRPADRIYGVQTRYGGLTVRIRGR